MDFLVIDDDKTFRDATCFLIEDEGHYAEGVDSGQMGMNWLKDEKYDAVLLDMNLGPESGLDILTQIQKQYPQIPVVIITAQGSIQTAVEAMRRGASDFLEKPFQRDQFVTVLARIQRLGRMGQQIRRLEQEVTETRAQSIEPIFDFTNPAIKGAMDVLMRASKTPASILILGESGTGKTVAARVVHQNSHLAEKPFVTVSCPSLSKELLESELFGHVKGSFTGAIKDHWGKVRAADGGTLFLDEIGDLPMEIQPKLLRLLQEREYERLGENVTRQANVRIIAATNRDLKKRVAEGAFREDLYFRLNVIAVEMPSLRTLDSDVVRFAEHYAKFFAAQCARKIEGFSPEAIASLRAYSWPGNLRELRNSIERAVIMAKQDKIVPVDFPSEMSASNGGSSGDGSAVAQVGALISLEKLEEMHLRKVLDRTPSLTEAAQILGIDQATLYRKRKKIGLE
ncbi:MAG TPA: sigma-54 dependent transcriptional regulator [Candidatus Acidoferrales bacterium]|jgi:NtrC-family two-component system response regulator AlgB|nr:sigma-54 dependent transcriptional regulator [Candidatus Acidoferrales bacterium]